ncbi:MAG: hypothetical protein AAFW82_05190 [Pseudomonadota bacterium]
MNTTTASNIRAPSWLQGHRALKSRKKLNALIGAAALLVMATAHVIPAFVFSQNADTENTAEVPSATSGRAKAGTPAMEWAFGGYGGVTYTHPASVEIKNSDRNTDLTVKDFGWIGRPFKAPVYYGVRIQRWPSTGSFGTMLDFTHAKAISKREDEATFSGTLNGEEVKEKQRIGDFFRHLEFSHGHNMLTLNGLARLAPAWSRFRPYVGAGAGISLPHTEVGIHKEIYNEDARTYEYQFAGFVGQGLAGLEIQLGRASVFLEYKFSYAPYNVPLSHEYYGWLLITDLWRQFSSWWAGEKPPGGRLTTTLATHHGIAGVMVRNHTGISAPDL